MSVPGPTVPQKRIVYFLSCLFEKQEAEQNKEEVGKKKKTVGSVIYFIPSPTAHHNLINTRRGRLFFSDTKLKQLRVITLKRAAGEGSITDCRLQGTTRRWHFNEILGDAAVAAPFNGEMNGEQTASGARGGCASAFFALDPT